MNDEIPQSYPCPHCSDPMTFKGIAYWLAKELYECKRCAELVEKDIPDMLPRRVVA